ncbi:protein CTR9 homolog [Vigna radiata var. radiata]|uniref:Protein CTR9 homolog n=1 Tax=Vigna radiata var. radiata TaxID=3916 RepID=A0A1S3TFU4_VIGRR|nr:protein CTR9 homolog [Vigna radiata var. radiata]
MQREFEIYPYCAMALNYLVNHFFFTGQHFLVEQLTETALAVTNHEPTKSHSYYNLARSYHSKALGHIYVQLGQIDKGQDFIRRATKIDPLDAQVVVESGNKEQSACRTNFK